MPATIKDVAKRAQVSISTISKYINGLPVREANRLRIEEAIASLDFRVNPMARGLRTRRTMTVGVLIPNLEVSFFTELVAHIERTLRARNYLTILCEYAVDPALQIERMRFLRDKNVDALIVIPLGIGAAAIREMQEAEIPVVLVDRECEEGLVCDTILAENEQAARGATAYLLGMGHRRIGMLCGPLTTTTARERLMGFEAAYKDVVERYDPSLVLGGEYDIQSAYERTRMLLSRPDKPTALFVTNHEMMTGAVLALGDMQTRIPEDISFVGFDNHALAEAVRPRLAHVLQPVKAMGEMAALCAWRRLSGEEKGPPRLARMETSFYPGESVLRVCAGAGPR